MKSIRNCKSSGVVRSKIVIGPFALSVPLSTATPRKFVLRTSIVSEEVPAKTSKKRMFSNRTFRVVAPLGSSVKHFSAVCCSASLESVTLSSNWAPSGVLGISCNKL